MTEEQKKQLKARNDDTPFETAKEAKKYIEEEF